MSHWASQIQSQVGPPSVVSLRQVTSKTLDAVCELSDTLSQAQKHMVATNAFSIAEAHFSSHAWFRAIYADEIPVGFIMLHDSNQDEPGYFLWRLMIGGPYQGMSFGRRAVELLIEYVRTRPGATELMTSCGRGEASPQGFYLKLGFRPNGKVHGDDGEEMGLSLPLGVSSPQVRLGCRKDLPVIAVREMTDGEFTAFRLLMIEDYAQRMVSNYGLPLDEMREHGVKLFDSALPRGFSTERCIFYTVTSGDSSEIVGFLWCSIDEDRKRGQIDEIFVLEPYRGKGFGKKILGFVDEKMREMRMRRIALHVFADNTVAVELYRKHGYRVTDMNMHKWL